MKKKIQLQYKNKCKFRVINKSFKSCHVTTQFLIKPGYSLLSQCLFQTETSFILRSLLSAHLTF